MSRFQLSGYGDPIPNIALPDPQLSADMPIQSLVLADGSTFEKADWVALGYTHYEVWCVGAAGGQGASAGEVHVLTSQTQVVMPDWLWEMEIQSKINELTFNGQTAFPHYEFSTVPGHTGEVVTTYYTPRQEAIYWLEYFNPNHLTTIFHQHDPFVLPSNPGVLGGGGGGGGLHVVSGELADLPNSVPVTVGSEGLQAPPGQIESPNPYDPFVMWDAQPQGYYLSNPDEWQRFAFTHTWPDLADRTFLPLGGAGGAGGHSSFGDICMASGGMGGGPAIVWVENVAMFASHGGEGGSGGRTAAGGGAAGSVSSSQSGKDGTWDGEIGTGGGGGRGGWAEIKPNAPQEMLMALPSPSR